MGDRGNLSALLDRGRWKRSSNGRGLLVAQLTVEEATLLDTDGMARRSVQDWVLALPHEDPPITGLLMFILDHERTIRGFVEMLLHDGEFSWSGPHGPMGPLP